MGCDKCEVDEDSWLYIINSKGFDYQSWALAIQIKAVMMVSAKSMISIKPGNILQC